jgi:hypothetical protein
MEYTPITKQEEFFKHCATQIIQEQKNTNELLQQLLDIMKPPKEGVEQVESDANDKSVKRKRR